MFFGPPLDESRSERMSQALRLTVDIFTAGPAWSPAAALTRELEDLQDAFR